MLSQSRGLTRRQLGTGTLGALGVGLLEPPLGAAAATPAYDPQQRFIRLVGGGNGSIFAVQADGSLLWYRNTGWATASGGWASGSRRVVGSGWHQFTEVMGSADGSLYALSGNGTIRYYRRTTTNLTTGDGYWTSYGQIGAGFDRFARVFGFGGDVYGVTNEGELLWYQYNPPQRRWNIGSGKALPGNFRHSELYADAGGVIYAVRFGNVYWHQRTATGGWATGSGTLVGTGYLDAGYHGLQFLGSGVLAAIRPNAPTASEAGWLYTNRLTNYATVGRDGRGLWSRSGIGSLISSGFTVEEEAALQGYALTRSVRQGDQVQVAVSTTFPSYTWAVVRVGLDGGMPVVSAPVATTGRVQLLPVGYLGSGCGWSPTVRFQTTGWAPGLYAVRLEGLSGMRRHVPFVVRPSGVPVRDVAVILPTNTYNAYNGWGGHTNYCTDLFGARSLTLDRPSREHDVLPTGLVEHTLYSDVLLLQALSRNGIDHDCYDDVDVHTSGAWLAQYKVVILGSHPEYWTTSMRQNILDYLAGGGHLVYTGGNGICEQVGYTSTLRTMTTRSSTGGRLFYVTLGLPPSQVLGVNYRNAGWFTFAPYRVVKDHPVLTGTGLAVGDSFGATGYNGGASGWEMDGFIGAAGEAPASAVIASGTNAEGGAQMVMFDTPSGGFVFSAASIAFNGALAGSPAMSKLLVNVINLGRTAPAPQPAQAVQERVTPISPQPEFAVR